MYFGRYKHNLAHDLFDMSDIKDNIADEKFCVKLYSTLTNTDWVKLETEQDRIVYKLSVDVNNMKYHEAWSASFRSVAGIVANLRNVLLKSKTIEDYMDWYCSGNEGYPEQDIVVILNKGGWYEAKSDC